MKTFSFMAPPSLGGFTALHVEFWSTWDKRRDKSSRSASTCYRWYSRTARDIGQAGRAIGERSSLRYQLLRNAYILHRKKTSLDKT
jgi:hypothetical protein